MHPYQNLPDSSFFSRSIPLTNWAQFNPVLKTRFNIVKKDQVATLGSCFAQHVARHLKASGLKYFQTEFSSEVSPKLASDEFSAAYGNVYTVRQALQLLDRAFEGWEPGPFIFERDGLYYDAFRPTVFESGFTNVSQLLAAREMHLKAVRRVFTESDVIVFTLGLTEAWCDRKTGVVFPVAPGVAAGEFDPQHHEFKNFSVAEVVSDLAQWCDRLKALNPRVRIILTVSPVPLAATAEDVNVWVATTLSKSVLRVAVSETVVSRPYVDYFPSYEIITSPSIRGRYFEDDARSVNRLGVAHVMRIFDKSFLDSGDNNINIVRFVRDRIDAQNQISSIKCDEELLDGSAGTKSDFDRSNRS